MKKFLSYILIIIILAGALGLTAKVHSADSLGDCVENLATGVSGPPQTISNVSQPDCTSQHPGWTWTSTGGTCTISGFTTKADCVNGKGSWVPFYNLLAPLPNPDNPSQPFNTFDSTQNNNLGAYLNLMLKIFIGLCAVLAVIMITIGGIQYMTTELISSKEEGRERIMHAIFGLLLALGAWTLLNQINPDLLRTDLKSLTNVTVSVTDLGSISNTPSVPIQSNALQKIGITDCTGSGGKGSVATIAQEFIGKTNYSQNDRNKISGNTINLDCTSFVDQVYNCAGLAMPQITGANIASASTLPNAKPIDGKTFDFSTLHSGDIIGWGTNSDGHVAIYLGKDSSGNEQVIDTNKSGNTQIIPLSYYKNKYNITFVMWSK
jgi:type IV secretory pathway VirB2 component (pilin)